MATSAPPAAVAEAAPAATELKTFRGNDDITLSIYETEKIGIIRLQRPVKKRNAVTKNNISQILDAFDAAASDDRVSVIVFTGAPRKEFCVGVDMTDLDLLEDATRPMYHPSTIHKPVVCAINGACAGVGLALAAHCDVRFLDSKAKVTSAYAQRGLVTEHGLSDALPRLIGAGRAGELLLSARTISAEEACGYGIAEFLVDNASGKLSIGGSNAPTKSNFFNVAPKHLAMAGNNHTVAAALAYSCEMATWCAPASLAAAKWQNQRHAVNQDKATNLKESDLIMHSSIASKDADAGFAAFREKRPPVWKPANDAHPVIMEIARLSKM